VSGYGTLDINGGAFSSVAEERNSLAISGANATLSIGITPLTLLNLSIAKGENIILNNNLNIGAGLSIGGTLEGTTGQKIAFADNTSLAVSGLSNFVLEDGLTLVTSAAVCVNKTFAWNSAISIATPTAISGGWQRQ
jgi:hypothetical protein